jgi:hypothetical protein
LENEALYDGRAQRARLQFADARTFAPLTFARAEPPRSFDIPDETG